LYTPCILDCALRFSNKNFDLLIKKNWFMWAILTMWMGWLMFCAVGFLVCL